MKIVHVYRVIEEIIVETPAQDDEAALKGALAIANTGSDPAMAAHLVERRKPTTRFVAVGPFDK